jgi:hypothetical protein
MTNDEAMERLRKNAEEITLLSMSEDQLRAEVRRLRDGCAYATGKDSDRCERCGRIRAAHSLKEAP